jgi:hypothetical protein
VISQKEVTQILEHVFGAKPKKLGGVRSLIFNTGKLQRLGKVYDLSIQVQVLQEDSSSEKSGSDRTDVSDMDTGNDVAASSTGLDTCTVSEEIELENTQNEKG